jgi:RNase P/RNase MRP subunit p29
MLQSGGVIAESQEEVAIVGQAEGATQRLLAQMARSLIGIGGRVVDGAVGGGERLW